MAQNFGSRKHWNITTNKHFGIQNIGGLATLHSKIARIKIVGGLVSNCRIHQFSSVKILCYTVTRKSKGQIEQESLYVCTRVRVCMYVCICMCVYMHMNTLTSADLLWHTAISYHFQYKHMQQVNFL